MRPGLKQILAAMMTGAAVVTIAAAPVAAADTVPTSPAVVSTAHPGADLTVIPAGHGYGGHGYGHIGHYGFHGYGGPGFVGPDYGFGYYRHWWPWRW
ncbi:hypothetical protein H7J93_04930 [Mycobacterium barrassiae]|uniref:hypothetical protein n=1 Tax=Mycobacterium barrassiae TaxID=319709 RepID=UPI002265C70D|nr:hypothetical protein [Mycobacterium barrassiae]MCV7298979.1 hypothetical protein [Mycobacterium barrassiae]